MWGQVQSLWSKVGRSWSHSGHCHLGVCWSEDRNICMMHYSELLLTPELVGDICTCGVVSSYDAVYSVWEVEIRAPRCDRGCLQRFAEVYVQRFVNVRYLKALFFQ